jgi:hypothetical protein
VDEPEVEDTAQGTTTTITDASEDLGLSDADLEGK